MDGSNGGSSDSENANVTTIDSGSCRDDDGLNVLPAFTSDSCHRQVPKRPKPKVKPIPPPKPSRKLVHASIDIGTTYSGCAFQYRHIYNSDPVKISANEWTDVAQGQRNVKTPTCVLLNPDKSLNSFGHEAIDKYGGFCMDGKQDTYFFFWQFKMSLHQGEEIQERFKLRAENGQEVEGLHVFTMAIKYLMDHLMQIFKNSMSEILIDDIGWSITVPAIWNETAKKFMRLAAEKAGMPGGNVEIALEPEAASLYCRMLKTAKDSELEEGLSEFPVGTKYMVLDCGGGTVDVTVHEILELGALRELHTATGGSWGGNNVNKKFLAFTEELVGPEAFQQFCRENKGEYFELLDTFEKHKRSAKPNNADYVNITLPYMLSQGDNKGHIESVCRQKHNKKVELHRTNKLRIHGTIFQSFFEEAVLDIVRHIKEILEELPDQLNAVLMVGGFSECAILKQAVEDSIPDDIRLIIPDDASLCVMKGAVLYGYQPSIITERRSRYTYGVAWIVPFEKGVHPENKKIRIDGKWWCDDVFDIHVRVGEIVKFGEWTEERRYFPSSASDPVYSVVLYRSKSQNPKFIDDDDCSYVGKFHAPRTPDTTKPWYQDPVWVRLSFGNSEISGAMIKDDGTIQRATFDF